MKTPRRTFAFVLLVLLLSVVSCQQGPGTPAPFNNPAQNNSTASAPGSEAQPEPAATKVSGGAAGQSVPAAGQFVLDSTDLGLTELTSYRQRLTSTVAGTFNGQPYNFSETVERTVAALGETERLEGITNGEAMYLYTARLGDVVYSQSNAESPCRAVPASEHPAVENPALNLPPVYNAALANNEPLDGIPAVRYEFDSRSVPNAAGKNDQAAGALWTAAPGGTLPDGILLKYDLTVQVKEGEFTGERTWHYTLEVGDFTPELPANCQPLLDLPTPPGAEDVINQPGFMRFTVQSGYGDVRQFYLSALPGEGWEPLPSTQMEPDPAAPKDVIVLIFTKASPDGSGQVAVIQLIDNGSALTAAVQVINTKSALESYDPTEKGPAPDEDEDQPSEPEQPPAQQKLPEDLPAYKGGTVIMETEAMVMFTSPDEPEKILEFYAAELEEGGWKQVQDTAVQGTWMQLWEKGAERLMIVVSRQGEETTVVISPG